MLHRTWLHTSIYIPDATEEAAGRVRFANSAPHAFPMGLVDLEKARRRRRLANMTARPELACFPSSFVLRK